MFEQGTQVTYNGETGRIVNSTLTLDNGVPIMKVQFTDRAEWVRCDELSRPESSFWHEDYDEDGE